MLGKSKNYYFNMARKVFTNNRMINFLLRHHNNMLTARAKRQLSFLIEQTINLHRFKKGMIGLQTTPMKLHEVESLEKHLRKELEKELLLKEFKDKSMKNSGLTIAAVGAGIAIAVEIFLFVKYEYQEYVFYKNYYKEIEELLKVPRKPRV